MCSDINVEIEQGSLVAVVGQVGAGKSSLISAMLGEMIKVKGYVNVRDKTSYVSQQAWIQNATLQENILFDQEMDRERYDKILEACALNPDLAILPAGDLTEIGEKGINLSGGQKQRVSLARAVYFNADICFLDDPLSAVDSHVGKHIFEEVVGDKGLLSGKTRILVTHGVQWLPHVDKIIVLTNGEISEMGTYDELMDHNGPFADYLRTYLNVNDDSDEEEDPEGSHAAKSKKKKEAVKRAVSQVEAKDDKAEETVDKNKLIEEENVEVGQVKLGVFMQYARSVGLGWSILIIVLYGLYAACVVAANILLSKWTDDDILSNRSLPGNSSVYREQNDFYLGIYGGLGMGQVVLILLFTVVSVVRSVKASRKLHSDMLMTILRSPMSFFDTTPIGRIVNRFSGDIDTIDNELPMTFEMWLDCFFIVFSTLIVISYSTPIFLSVILPLGIMYFLIQRFYIATSRQLKRLDSKTRSPIYNHFSESLTGASVIRAFKVSNRFIRESEERVDVNHQYLYSNLSSNRWLGFRLELVGNLIVLAAAIFAVVSRENISGALVGLSISYALEVTGNLTWFVRMTSDLEMMVVSVERVKEYIEKPVEAELINYNNRPWPGWPELGGMCVQNYSTRYREGLDLVLKSVNAAIKPGEKVGIVGRTGGR
ncbi:hypothetical protein ScPMuIL_012251 [Solemya velum]